MPDVDAVTGAFSYTGRAIAERLLADGVEVRTLTRRLEERDPLAAKVDAVPLQFTDPPALSSSLRGVRRLYNTYWIRFPHGDTTYETAIANTRTLFAAAAEAGVERIVHVSVTNPAEDSPLPYFRGKARLERDLSRSGLSHAIVRPTLVFGPKDILVNNIAWVLRRFPFFVVPGDGAYRVQPVSVGDTARIAVEAAEGPNGAVLDAAGPETFSFSELVHRVREAVDARAAVLYAPPRLALALSTLVGRALGDVMLTREELDGLMQSLLVSEDAPRGRESFGSWLAASRDTLGRSYVSELNRNFSQARDRDAPV